MATDLVTATNQELRELAEHGDRAALKTLIERFKDNPRGLIQYGLGDLVWPIASLLTENMCKDQDLLHHTTMMEFKEICRNLAGPNPTALEQLLANRCALTWLELHTLQLRYAADTETKNMKILEFRDRRIERAERRHLRALKTLADVRKLNLPPINIDLRSQLSQPGVVAQLLGAPKSVVDRLTTCQPNHP